MVDALGARRGAYIGVYARTVEEMNLRPEPTALDKSLGMLGVERERRDQLCRPIDCYRRNIAEVRAGTRQIVWQTCGAAADQNRAIVLNAIAGGGFRPPLSC